MSAGDSKVIPFTAPSAPRPAATRPLPTAEAPLRVLIVDDSPEDRMIVRLALESLGYLLSEVDNGERGVAAAAALRPHCILLDYHLPDLDGREVLDALRQPDGSMPCAVVMLTGSSSGEAAVKLLKAGALDYLSKERLNEDNLRRAVQGSVERYQLIEERHRAEVRNAYLASIVESSSDAIFSTDLDDCIRSWNPGAAALFGYTADEAIGQLVEELIVPEHLIEQRRERYRDVMAGRVPRKVETERRRKDGKLVPVEINASPMFDASGGVIGISAMMRDITERQRADLALRESEGRHAFLLKLSDTLLPLRDPVKVQTATMRLVVEHLDVIRASYFKIDPDQDGFSLTANYDRGALPIPDQMRISDFAPDMADQYRKGQIFVLEDAEKEVPAGPERAAYRSIGVRAAVGVPLIKDGLLLGVFGVNSTTPRHWTVAEVQLLKDIADRVWAAVEQAQAEAALREREDELSRAHRIAGIGSFKVEVRDGNFVADRSPEYLAVHGLTPQDRGNSHDAWLRRLHPADREKADRTFRECLADGRKLYQSEYRIIRQNDSATRWIKVLAEIERDASGAPLRLFGTHLDVTESRLHEAALRTSEIRYRRLFEAAHDGVLILDPATRKIIDANPFMTALLGYPHDELIGMELYEIGFLADAQASRDMFQALKATRQVRYENLPLQTRQGGLRDVEVVANLYDENGHSVVQCNVRDITERRRAEAELHERQNFLDGIFAVLPGVLYIFDLDENRVVFSNKRVVGSTYSSEEIAAMGGDFVMNLMHADDQPRFQEYIARIRMLDPGTMATFEYRMKDKAGEWHWYFNTDTVYLRDENGVARQFIGVALEITDRKLAELAVQVSDNRFRLAISNSPITVFEQDINLRYTWLYNPKLGFDNTSTLGRTDAELLDPAVADRLDVVKRRALETGQHSRQEVALERPGHGLNHFELSVEPRRGPDGQIDGVICTSIDITERKNAEAALRDSETRLSRILNQSPAGIVQTDAGGRMLLVNERWCEMLGYSESEMLGMTVVDVTHPSSVEATLEAIGRLAKGGPNFQIDKNYRRKDGTILQVNSNVIALRDAQGNYQGLLAVVLDMTKRLEIEERLRESAQRIALAAETTGLGIWEWNIQSNKILWDAQMFRIYGLPPTDDGFVSYETWRSAVHPEDMARDKGVLEDAIQSNARGSREFRILRADTGEYRTIHAVEAMRAHPEGKSEWMVGTNLDITERKRQEEHVRLLMGEVNHRSKNMLSLVQAIAKRTVAARPEDFIERFGQRVQALAASQDLLVKSEWKAVSLGELVRAQLAHFGDALDTRVALDGPLVEITASASQALGMALHELATNAAKYGALSNEAGRVAIRWSVGSDTAGKARFTMSWVESGGPPVAKPTRQGFGSTVTGAMIKMSLGCDAEVDFAPTGLVWRIDCPAEGMIEGSALSAPQWNGAALKEQPAQASSRHRVLVVEDEPLIAMDIAHTLAEAGYDVIGPAHSVAMALALIARSGCDAAVLDINLGAETSEPVARELIRRGTPFIATSGYTREQQPELMRTAPLLGKPLNFDLLVANIERCLADHNAP